jgi:hypothetical protein
MDIIIVEYFGKIVGREKKSRAAKVDNKQGRPDEFGGPVIILIIDLYNFFKKISSI